MREFVEEARRVGEPMRYVAVSLLAFTAMLILVLIVFALAKSLSQ